MGRDAWTMAVGAWKGAFGLGTLAWASYGAFLTTFVGVSPGRGGDIAFAAGAVAGAWMGARAQGAASRQTLT